MLTTPMRNFAVARRRCHGVMVTASHNPGQYNGFKSIDADRVAFVDEVQRALGVSL